MCVVEWVSVLYNIYEAKSFLFSFLFSFKKDGKEKVWGADGTSSSSSSSIIIDNKNKKN